MQTKKKSSRAGAPRRNKNAGGKRVDRDRVPINMSVSEKNGLLPLFQEYLFRQGIDPTDDNIKQVASDSAYRYWGEWLKREIEINDTATII